MKELKNKKVIVRLTETQLNQLIQNVEDEKSTISEIIRESLENKLNKIQIDDYRRRKFKF